MSDTFLRLIPIDPSFVPPLESQQQAQAVLKKTLPDADETNAYETPEIEFISAGGNFESITCPICKREIDQTWWADAVEVAFQNGFRNLMINTPCCGNQVSLNDLKYHFPQGFAKFVLEARNPNIPKISESVKQRLEFILGKKLREIYARY